MNSASYMSRNISNIIIVVFFSSNERAYERIHLKEKDMVLDRECTIYKTDTI